MFVVYLDGAPGPDFKKYQAMFQFEARNFDELTLVVGNVVWVSDLTLTLTLTSTLAFSRCFEEIVLDIHFNLLSFLYQ